MRFFGNLEYLICTEVSEYVGNSGGASVLGILVVRGQRVLFFCFQATVRGQGGSRGVVGIRFSSVGSTGILGQLVNPECGPNCSKLM